MLVYHEIVHFDHSSKTKELIDKVSDFMEEYVYPAEEIYAAEMKAFRESGNPWQVPKIISKLKQQAKTQGLWNFFLPESNNGFGLTNLEYAPLAELMGKVSFASEVFNCSAPDTGNMEVLDKFGSDYQKEKWLRPLLDGEIRSAFAMTEPRVASSDATNIESKIEEDGDEYVINGEKWWTSGFGRPDCKIMIFMGVTNPENPKHQRQSQILVPTDAKGIENLRMLTVYGADHAPNGHAHLKFTNVRVPKENLILGEGRGFEIAQGRLGPGRIHHCMRLIGLSEVALEKMCKRTKQRVAFGKPVSEQTVTQERIAEARIMIDSCRFLTLHAAHKMDVHGNKEARKEIAMIKVAAPNMTCKIVDWAIQAHGAGGVSNDFGLSRMYAHSRTLRLADGPDEVHRNQIARLELKRHN